MGASQVRGGGAAFLEQRGFQGRVAGVAGYPGASGAICGAAENEANGKWISGKVSTRTGW